MSDKKNNIQQNLNEELFVNDLNDSLDSNIDDVLDITKTTTNNTNTHTTILHGVQKVQKEILTLSKTQM